MGHFLVFQQAPPETLVSEGLITAILMPYRELPSKVRL
jgi:hypothetical protein